MATVGKIVAVLTAHTKPFMKGMRRAQKTTKKFAASVAGMAKRMAKLGAAFAAAAIGGLALLVRRQITLIDQLGKTSRKLGVAASALQALRLAAELSGVPIAQLDMGLQRMTRRIAEAAMGTGEAQAALKELGLDATTLNGLSLEKQFQAIAEAFEKVTNKADRVRLGFKLFDSEGVALINTLSLGADALREMERETERLGLSLTAFDIGLVEEAKDSLTKLKAIVSGVAQKITVELAPFLTVAVEKLVKMGTEGRTMGDFVSAAMEKAAIGAAFLARTVDQIKLAYQAVISTGALLQLQWAKVKEALAETLVREIRKGGMTQTDDLVSATLKWHEAIKETARLQDLADGKLGNMAETMEGLAADDAFNEVLRKFRKMQQEIAAAREAAEGLGDEAEDNLGGVADAAAKAAARMERLKDAAKSVFEATRTPLEKFNAEMERLKELLETVGEDGKSLISPDTFKRAVEAAQKALDDATKPQEKKFQQAEQVNLRRIKIGGAGGGGKSILEKANERQVGLLQQIKGALEDGFDKPFQLEWN